MQLRLAAPGPALWQVRGVHTLPSKGAVAAKGKLSRAAHQEAGGVVGAGPVDAANGGEEAGAPILPHARRGIGIVCAAGCAAVHRFTMLPVQCRSNSCSALNPISTAAGASGRPAQSLTGAARPLLLRPVDVAAAGVMGSTS